MDGSFTDTMPRASEAGPTITSLAVQCSGAAKDGGAVTADPAVRRSPCEAPPSSSERRTRDFKSNSDYTKPTAPAVVSFYDPGVVPELT